MIVVRVSAKEKFKVGAHGYDNAEPKMRAIFMASGPAFKKNYTAVQFDNVDLYPLISRIAGLKEPSRRTDGTMKAVEQLLSVGAAPTSTPPVLGILSALLLHSIARSLWTQKPPEYLTYPPSSQSVVGPEIRLNSTTIIIFRGPDFRVGIMRWLSRLVLDTCSSPVNYFGNVVRFILFNNIIL